MATSTQLRAWWADHRCKTNLYERVGFPGAGRTWDLLVAAQAAPAFRLLAQAMTQTGYLFRESAGGSYRCRKIAGSEAWSLHAYALAVDLNPSKNPFGLPLRHDFPAEFIELVEGIRTNNGKQVFTWGGRWSKPDAMHWQINCSPADLATGLVYPQPPQEEPLMLPISADSPIENIRLIQRRLGLSVSGSWDPATVNGVKALAVRSGTGDPWGKAGTHVNGIMYNFLAEEQIRRVAGEGEAGGLSEAQVRAIVNQSIIETTVTLRPR